MQVLTTNNMNLSDTSFTRQLFLPEEFEAIRLNSLRQKRRELEQKLKMVSNRINFRKKKEEGQIKRYIISQERSRMMSETKNYKRINEMLKEELAQKKQFQIKKKAKQVEDYRLSHSRRLQLINQSVRDRKLLESQKLRRIKKMDEQILNSTKNSTCMELKQKHEDIVRMKERQLAKKKYFWLVEKRLSFQQNMIEEAQIYEKQIQEFHKKIKKLRQDEEELRAKEQHAAQVLRCAEQNYQLLKKA